MARSRPRGEPSLDEAGLLQTTETVSEDVRGDSLSGVEELSVAGAAEEQVPDDQERPLVPDHVEGTRDGAVRALEAQVSQAVPRVLGGHVLLILSG